MASPPRDGTEIDPLERWDSWVDAAIREAQKRGEFDDLPGRGQPLHIDDNPFAGDRALGFHALKNAGVLPYWMELEKEIGAELAALRELRERTAHYLSAPSVPVPAGAVEPERPAGGAGLGRRLAALVWWLLGENRSRSGQVDDSGWSESVAREGECRRARRAYLERAARLDGTIRRYNAALPDDLRWRERARLSPDQAARDFDAVCPAVAFDGDPTARTDGGRPADPERPPFR